MPRTTNPQPAVGRSKRGKITSTVQKRGRC
jgi:hypothetical protein